MDILDLLEMACEEVVSEDWNIRLLESDRIKIWESFDYFARNNLD
jgi:hypothetical protein